MSIRARPPADELTGLMAFLQNLPYAHVMKQSLKTGRQTRQALSNPSATCLFVVGAKSDAEVHRATL